jgi:hypothetical protein
MSEPDKRDAGRALDSLSLRDYFASAAMQAYLQAPAGSVMSRENQTAVAQSAYTMADAMLEARKR